MLQVKPLAPPLSSVANGARRRSRTQPLPLPPLFGGKESLRVEGVRDNKGGNPLLLNSDAWPPRVTAYRSRQPPSLLAIAAAVAFGERSG